MALNKPNTQAAAQFETFEDTDAVATETVAVAYTETETAKAEAESAAAANVPAVQVVKPSALAVEKPKGNLPRL